MILIRYRHLPDRTLGKLIVGNVVFETMEREGPDSIEKNEKRIVPGIYKLGKNIRSDYRIDVVGVPGRSGIQLHTGSKPSHSKGCILVLGSKQLGLNSKKSILWLQQHLTTVIEILNA